MKILRYSKSKSSSKMLFWGSEELSPGIIFFDGMNLCDNSKIVT
jgi:hypothetical protein